jgi:hypothetical protein
MTEGEYGNPSVVRRQTTSAKLNELKERLFPGIANFYYHTLNMLSAVQRSGLLDVSQRMLVRGTRSTTTTRVSNRTRRTTTPRSTTPRSTTPRSTTPRSTTPAAPAAAPSQRTTSSYPGQVNTENEFNQLVNYVNSIGEDSIESRKNKIFLCVPLFKYLLDKKFKEAPEPSSGIVSLTNADISSIFYKLNQEINSLDLWISFGFLIYGFRTINTNRAVALVSFLPRNRRNRDGLNTISKKFGMEDRNFVKKILAHLEGKRILPSGPSAVVSYMVASSNALRAPFSNFIIGSYKKTEGKRAFQLDRPNFVFSYGEDSNRPSASASTQTFRQTEAISTSQLQRNSTPTQVEVRATPDASVTDLVKEAKFKNTLGIEIEYQEVTFGEMKEGLKKAKIDLYPRYLAYHESVDYDKYKQWRIMHDGSLKDRFGRAYSKTIYNSRGREEVNIPFGELVSPILVGEKGLLQLIRALNAMTKLGATNNQSTGLHIHLGIKDTNQPFGISYKGLRNFIVNYIGFEKIIDSYTRKSRRQNNHRQYTPSPIVDIWRSKALSDGRIEDVTYSELEELSRKLNAFDDTEFRRWAVMTLQRGKLNPHSNGLKFSFEIRQHGGTIERDTIMGWVLFMHYLCVFSEKKVSTRFTWKNLSENILPKPLASFWQNRIADMSGEALDYRDDSWKTFPDAFNGPVKR